MLGWNLGLFYNSACSWTLRWQPAKGEAAFESASDIPEECQMLRLHREEGFETWQQEALQHPAPHGNHQGVCTRARAGPPQGALKASAVFHLCFTCLVNSGCGALAFLFLITVVSSVNILDSRLVLERLALFFVIKLYFS